MGPGTRLQREGPKDNDNWHEAAQAWLEAAGLGAVNASLVYSLLASGHLLDFVMALVAKEHLFEDLKREGPECFTGCAFSLRNAVPVNA